MNRQLPPVAASSLGFLARTALPILAGIVLVAVAVYLFFKNGDDTPATHNVAAPIDRVEIRVLPSSPPQYVINALAAVPNACSRPAGYEVERDEAGIRVRILNLVPTREVVCTPFYAPYELNIPLGSDFEPGQDYTVEVNERIIVLHAE